MNVQNDNNAFLREAARVAYGSRFFEKQNGGYGSIGVLKDPYGRDRIVKFNTRNWEEGVVTDKMLEVSNSLREKLWGIAKEMPQLRGARREEIRKLLNIDRRGKSGTTELLKRTIVARVITKIGGQRLWDEALAEKSIKSYSSKGLSTKFQAVYDAAAGVGNDARRSLANGVLNDAMNSVIAALPKQGDDLTPFSRKIKDCLYSLLTDDVRRCLADTKGGGKEIRKACQAFIRQNALRLACMEVNRSGDLTDDAARFVSAFLGIAPGAHLSEKLQRLGYRQNADFLRKVRTELGDDPFFYLLDKINKSASGKWTDEDPLRSPEPVLTRRLVVPLQRGRSAEWQVTSPMREILQVNGLLDGDRLEVGMLNSVARRAAIRQRDIAKKHYKAIMQQNESILNKLRASKNEKEGMRENMIELENEKKALMRELEEEKEYEYAEDLEIWKNLLKDVNGNNMNIVNVQNEQPIPKKAGKQVVQHNVIKSNPKGKGAVKQKNVVKQKFENPFMADLSPEDLAEIEGSRNT